MLVCGLFSGFLISAWMVQRLDCMGSPLVASCCSSSVPRFCAATRSAVYGLVIATSATPVFGSSVLSPLLGDTSIGTVGLVSLAINLTVPLAVILLEVAQASTAAQAPAQITAPIGKAVPNSNPIRKGLLSGLSSPLLWAPILGVIVVLLGGEVPPLVRNSLNFIGSATSGVAVFAVGLTLEAHQLILSRAVLLGTLGRITVQTSILLFGSHLAHLTGPFVREAIVCCSFPLSTVTVLLSAKYGDAESETASMLCLSTLALIVTVPLALQLTH